MKIIKGSTYFTTMNKIEECVTNYDRMNFKNNKTILYLANGDILNIRVLKNNIPHLLGVKLDYLKLSNQLKGINDAYDQLKCFLDRRQPFFELVSKEQLSFEPMFSKHVDDKLDIFVDSIKIRTDDMQYIVKYDREKTYNFEEQADICDYYLYRKIHGLYCLLGLIKSDKEDFYVPATIRKYDNHREFEDFMEKIAKKQEITYPTAIKIRNTTNDYKTDVSIKMSDKSVLLDKTIKAAIKYDGTASVARDYTYSLGVLTDKKTEGSKMLTLLQMLVDSIKSKNTFELDTFYGMCGEINIKDEVIELIDACNNMVCNSGGANNTSYSDISHERDKLKKELLELKEEITKKNNEISELQSKNDELEKTNNSYSEQLSIYDEAYQKVKKIQENS